MHKVFLGAVQLPFAPPAITAKINNKNKTFDLINEGEINRLKQPGLTQVEFKCELPYKKYPFVQNFKTQKYFLDHLEKLKVGKEPFQFIVVRSGGFGTNLKVSLEDYTIEESANNARDLTITIKLKQFRDFGLKTVVIPPKKKASPTTTKAATPTKVPKPKAKRKGSPSKRGRRYKVKKGDCLWAIAKRYYGKGILWKKIYNANKSKIAARNKGKRVAYHTIYPGQVFIIPR